jgi:hypothetical protein
MNQFLVMAAAEKLSAIQTAEAFFAAQGNWGLPRTGREPRALVMRYQA